MSDLMLFRTVPQGVDLINLYRQGSAELGISELPNKYLATDRTPKKYFPKSKTLLHKHYSFGKS